MLNERFVKANTFFDKRIWLSTREAADYLRTSDYQVRNWVYQGKLACYKLFGKKLLFRRSDLDSLIKEGGRNWQ